MSILTGMKKWNCGVAFLVVAAVLGLSVPMSAVLAADGKPVIPEEQSAPEKALDPTMRPGSDDPGVKAGIAAYDAGDFKKAYDIWLPLAEAGNPEAQFRIGRMYDSGGYFPSDGSKAVAWYEKSSNHGHILARYNLAQLYYRGEWVQKDLSKAFQLFTASAELGHPNSQLAVALMYFGGEGVDANPAAGFQWLLLSKEFGADRADEAVDYFSKLFTFELRQKGTEQMRGWLLRHPRTRQ